MTNATHDGHEPSHPAGLGCNEGLGLEPERAAFEAWFSDQGRYPEAIERSGNGYKLMGTHSAWFAWKACWPLARAAERERCGQAYGSREVAMTAELGRLRAELADALHAMRAYARENPRHEYRGATQDPNGVHAWLARNDRA